MATEHFRNTVRLENGTIRAKRGEGEMVTLREDKSSFLNTHNEWLILISNTFKGIYLKEARQNNKSKVLLESKTKAPCI